MGYILLAIVILSVLNLSIYILFKREKDRVETLTNAYNTLLSQKKVVKLEQDK